MSQPSPSISGAEATNAPAAARSTGRWTPLCPESWIACARSRQLWEQLDPPTDERDLSPPMKSRANPQMTLRTNVRTRTDLLLLAAFCGFLFFYGGGAF